MEKLWKKDTTHTSVLSHQRGKGASLPTSAPKSYSWGNAPKQRWFPILPRLPCVHKKSSLLQFQTSPSAERSRQKQLEAGQTRGKRDKKGLQPLGRPQGSLMLWLSDVGERGRKVRIREYPVKVFYTPSLRVKQKLIQNLKLIKKKK